MEFVLIGRSNHITQHTSTMIPILSGIRSRRHELVAQLEEPEKFDKDVLHCRNISSLGNGVLVVLGIIGLIVSSLSYTRGVTKTSVELAHCIVVCLRCSSLMALLTSLNIVFGVSACTYFGNLFHLESQTRQKRAP